MKNIFTILLFLNLAVGFGQNNGAPKEDAILIKDKKPTIAKDSSKSNYNLIFTSVDVTAVPPGGMNEFRKYVGQSFRLPEVNKTTIGKVTTKFTVCNDGSICDIQVINESPVDLGLGDEVKRILNKSGNWKPAQKNETAVSSYYTLPIAIQITSSDIPQPAVKENNSTSKKD